LACHTPISVRTKVTAAAFRLEGVRSMQIAHTGRFNARTRAL